MRQSDTPTKDDPAQAEPPSPQTWRSRSGEILDRLSYAVGLGSVMLILVVIPALVWPGELGKYLNGYLYAVMVVIAYFCVPIARRYMPRFK